MADAAVVARLGKLLGNPGLAPPVRETALWILGRSGRKEAVPVLVAQLVSDQETVRRAAADGLTELTGLTHGTNRERWAEWWQRHKDLSREGWLEDAWPTSPAAATAWRAN